MFLFRRQQISSSPFLDDSSGSEEEDSSDPAPDFGVRLSQSEWARQPEQSEVGLKVAHTQDSSKQFQDIQWGILSLQQDFLSQNTAFLLRTRMLVQSAVYTYGLQPAQASLFYWILQARILPSRLPMPSQDLPDRDGTGFLLHHLQLAGRVFVCFVSRHQHHWEASQ